MNTAIAKTGSGLNLYLHLSIHSMVSPFLIRLNSLCGNLITAMVLFGKDVTYSFDPQQGNEHLCLPDNLRLYSWR